MEKRGVIEEGRTPPEQPPEGRKKADLEAQRPLESHATQRIADSVKDAKTQK